VIAPDRHPAAIPADVSSGIVSFTVDDQAEPADCAEPLAALLIALWRQRHGEQQVPDRPDDEAHGPQ
jgi:hypothetical protein